MAKQISLDSRKLLVGQVGLTIASVVLFFGQLFIVVAGTVSKGPYDGFVQLVPWVITSVVLLVSFRVSAKVRLGLLCAAVAMLAHLAFNFLFAIPVLIGNTRFVWQDNSPAYLGGGFSAAELLVIAKGDSSFILLGDILLWVGSGLAISFSIVVFVGLYGFLSSPAAKSSFSIDVTVLLVLLVAAIASGYYMQYSWNSANFSTYTLSFLLMTYLPLLLWLSFTMRHGGVVSIGSAAGLVGGVFLVPLVMGLLELALGGSSAKFVTEDGNTFPNSQNAYDIFNPLGAFSGVIAISFVLLLVIMWWNFSTFSQDVELRVLATTSSNVNSLSVLSFILSWIPLTAIPANILGHMAYDQVLHDTNPQRGLGLSRAAIILSYISLATGAFTIYTIWFN
jgi:hypothetical protein